MRNFMIVFYCIVLEKSSITVLEKSSTCLYRVDRLACFKINSGVQNDKISKELIKHFQTHGMK